MKIGDIQKFYAGRASLYERLFVRFLGWGAELNRFFRESDHLRPGMRILDAGCGTGVITRTLYEIASERSYTGMTFHAFDLTPEMLDIFKRWTEDRGVRDVRMVQANVLEPETLPPDWTDYDLIVTSTMLEYLPAQAVETVLAHLRRLLAPGGRLVILAAKRNFLTRWLASGWWKTNTFTGNQIVTLLRVAGFEKILPVKLSPGWSGSILVIEAEG